MPNFAITRGIGDVVDGIGGCGSGQRADCASAIVQFRVVGVHRTFVLRKRRAGRMPHPALIPPGSFQSAVYAC